LQKGLGDRRAADGARTPQIAGDAIGGFPQESSG
jgi:hypothetical protein